MIDLDALLVASMRMEPLPASVTRLAAIVAGNDVDLKEVVNVVSLDQALTARLLKTANSAYSASRHRFATVKDAVVRLGTGIVLSFAMAAALKKRLNESAPAYDLKEGALWRHSVASALGADVLKGLCRKSPLPAEVFTAALLHDIGKLAVARYAGPAANAAVKGARDAGVPTPDAEREALGIDHAELGAQLAASWNLPESLVNAIRGHHAAVHAPGPANVLADAIQLADHLAKAAEVAPEAPIPAPDPQLLANLGITEETCADARAAVRARLEHTLALYG